MPRIPAAEYPSNTARSSAKAILLAASFTGCQSESWAPRSTSSMSCRPSVNGARSSTSGMERRTRAVTPSPAASVSPR